MVNKTPVDYDYDIVKNVIIILDLNKGGKSVTNAIEWVLKEIKKDVGTFHGRKVIYRDSFGIYDGVLVDVDGNFKDFYSIKEKELDKALQKAKIHA
jgi:hypothetical protein